MWDQFALMRSNGATRGWLGSIAILVAMIAPGAHATFIDLRDMTVVFPGDPIVLGSTDGTAAGSYAEIGEGIFATIPLINDPYFGDPALLDPLALAPETLLSFDFTFSTDVPGSTGFQVTLFDDNFNAYDQQFYGTPGSDTYMFDLAGIIDPVGILFELLDFDPIDFTNGLVAISNMQVTDPNAVEPPVSVAEPGSLLLLLSGLAGLFALYRRPLTDPA